MLFNPHKQIIKPFFILGVFLTCLILIGGCGYYMTNNNVPVFSKQYSALILPGFKYIYIDKNQKDQGFANSNDLAQAFMKFDDYQVLDYIPVDEDVKKETLIVKYEYTYAKFWDVTIDPLDPANLDAENYYVSLASSAVSDGTNTDLYPTILNNAILEISFQVFDGASGKLLVETPLQISYQQVYQGETELKDRPDANKEFNRMSRLAFDRFVNNINFKNKKDRIYFEDGYKENFLTRFTGKFSDNPNLVKGIRFAYGANWKNALLTWLLVTYEPVNEDKYFALNRASALFNMGQVYSYFEQWDKAALMFAYANQSVKNTHYAQAWADAVGKWRIKVPQRLSYDDIIEYSLDVDEKIKINSTIPSLKTSVLWPDETFYQNLPD